MSGDIVPQKRCTKCDVEYPLTKEFWYFEKARKGIRYRCKRCIREYIQSPEERVRRRGYNQEYRKTPKRKAYITAYQREWEQQSEQRQKQKERRQSPINKAKHLIYCRWHSKLPEQKERMRQYQRKNYATPEGRAKNKTQRQNRRARRIALPNTLTVIQWQRCLEYFNHRCAVCGRPRGLWHTLAADHWIPLTHPDCPGTVATNIVPLCHGEGGCNNSKSNKEPELWLYEQCSKRKAKVILKRIQDYFS